MKLFKYKQFINESKQFKDIDSICMKYSITNYTINDDGTVDVNGDVNLNSKGLIKIPLRFVKVTGDFYCHNNQLTSLEGGPSEVGGNFYCSDNQLTSLEGGPSEVGGGFYCYNNQLTSLEGCPIKVDGDFDCHSNQLNSLEGCPTKVGYFSCSYNQLTSLEGSPSEVGGHFYCSDNQLKDVKGFPRFIKGGISIRFNPVYEIFKLFPGDRWKEVPEFLNEYDVIRDGTHQYLRNKVVLQALEVVYDELGLEVPENIEIEGYETI